MSQRIKTSTGSYHDLIADVTERELQWVGQEDVDMPDRAMYIEGVRRVQVWTLEWLAESLPEGHEFREMFEQLAHGVGGVPDIDLWMGEPGATGSA